MSPEAASRAVVLGFLGALIFLAGPGVAQERPSRTPPDADQALEVYAVTFEYQSARDAVALVRRMLSSSGSVEERPGGNSLVIRDTAQVIARVRPVLERFDHPPQKLRFEVKVVRAGPKRNTISPPMDVVDHRLPADLVEQLQGLLRYEEYRVVAGTEVTSREGENVTYALGRDYEVSFRLGAVLSSPRSDVERLRLENFKIVERAPSVTVKGRRLDSQELYNATFNLWMDRHFTLVLTRDEARNEALIVAISCRREPTE